MPPLLLALVLLWAPWTLVLTLLVPAARGVALHVLVGLSLTVLTHRAVGRLLRWPIAPARAGAWRLIPRDPLRGVKAAELGLGLSGLAAWWSGPIGRLPVVCALGALGLGLIGVAARWRRGPERGATLELEPGELVLRSPAFERRFPLEGATLFPDPGGGAWLLAAQGGARLRIAPRSSDAASFTEDADGLLLALSRALEGSTQGSSQGTQEA